MLRRITNTYVYNEPLVIIAAKNILARNVDKPSAGTMPTEKQVCFLLVLNDSVSPLWTWGGSTEPVSSVPLFS